MTAVLPPRPREMPRPVGRRLAIVPREGRSGGSLVAVVSILAFLASLAAGTAVLVATASAAWRTTLLREATIQLLPVAGRDREADLRRVVVIARGTPGLRGARALSAADSESLLAPWLGHGLDLSDLPVPRLVVLELGDPRPDLAVLAARLRNDVPGARLDDHGASLLRLTVAARTVVIGALVVVGLVLAASAGAIAFATRGAVASQREAVEVLHFVGASDGFIARGFSLRFAWLACLGGLIGSSIAVALLALAERLVATPAGSEGSALLGTLSVTGWTCAAAFSIPILDGIVAGIVAAGTVKRFLKSAR